MKKEINAAVKASPLNVDEIFLFRAMAKEFNHSLISRSTYVAEIHGGKGKVEFPSKYKTGGSARVELGDLLMFTFDKAKKELRMCVLQAKYKKGRYYRFLNADADLFQWELLHDKPDIVNKGRFHFPKNILNFRTDYESITAYGIFYHDNVFRDIDFLYTLPEFFKPASMPLGPTPNGRRSFHFRCPLGLGSPNYGCTIGITRKEAISTCSIDVFESQVLSCRVGAPIPGKGPTGSWALALLRRMRDYADDPEVIDELLDSYNRDVPEYYDSSEGVPSALVVVTDSEKYGESHVEKGLACCPACPYVDYLRYITDTM